MMMNGGPTIYAHREKKYGPSPRSSCPSPRRNTTGRLPRHRRRYSGSQNFQGYCPARCLMTVRSYDSSGLRIWAESNPRHHRESCIADWSFLCPPAASVPCLLNKTRFGPTHAPIALTRTSKHRNAVLGESKCVLHGDRLCAHDLSVGVCVPHTEKIQSLRRGSEHTHEQTQLQHLFPSGFFGSGVLLFCLSIVTTS